MIPLSMGVLLFKFGSKENYLTISIVASLLFIASISWIIYKKNKGDYSDYSISDRKQRYSFYHFAIPLIFITSFLFNVLDQPRHLIISFIFGGILMLISYLSNFFIKSSLHTSLNIYLAFTVFMLHNGLGVFIFCFAMAIAYSRVILKKHTFPEIVSGFIIGALTGIGLYFY